MGELFLPDCEFARPKFLYRNTSFRRVRYSSSTSMKKPLTRGEKWLFASPLLVPVLFFAPRLWHISKNLGESRLASDMASYPLMSLPDNRSILSVTSLEFSPDGKRLAVLYE